MNFRIRARYVSGSAFPCYRCGAASCRDEIALHLAAECPYRDGLQFDCPRGCGSLVQRETVAEHARADCAYRPVAAFPCPA